MIFTLILIKRKSDIPKTTYQVSNQDNNLGYPQIPTTSAINDVCSISAILKVKRSLSWNFLVILAGDIEFNPGPRNNTFKYACPACLRTVAKNHRAVECDMCQNWYHIKCEGISPKTYNVMVQASEKDEFNYICSPCHLNSLPYHEGFLDETDNFVSVPIIPSPDGNI